MVRPAKKQKFEETSASCKETVLFNSDALSKIVSYLPSIDLLSLALTNKRFGILNNDELSVIKESARIAVKDIATEEQLAALPRYDGESSLADYHYLQLLRAPLTFDQLVDAKYVDSRDKSCVTNKGFHWATAFSNNILRAGKHYVTFTGPCDDSGNDSLYMYLGVMRPGQADQYARGFPDRKEFFQHFTGRLGNGEHNENSIQCCFYHSYTGKCCIGDWVDSSNEWDNNWDGMKSIYLPVMILGCCWI